MGPDARGRLAGGPKTARIVQRHGGPCKRSEPARSGVQGRLSNLGYDCGDEHGELGPVTRSALRAFQETYEMTVNGEADSATREKLQEKYGC